MVEVLRMVDMDLYNLPSAVPSTGCTCNILPGYFPQLKRPELRPPVQSQQLLRQGTEGPRLPFPASSKSSYPASYFEPFHDRYQHLYEYCFNCGVGRMNLV